MDTDTKFLPLLPPGLQLVDSISLPDSSYRRITAIAISPEGNNLAIGASSKNDSRLFIKDKNGHWSSVVVGEGRIWSLDWKVGGEVIAVGWGGEPRAVGGASVWTFKGGQLSEAWSFQEFITYVVRWAPRGNRLAAGLGTLFGSPTGESVARRKTKKLSRGEKSDGVVIFEGDSGKILHRIDNGSHETGAIAWLGNHTLATTHSNQDIALWDLRDLEKPKLFDAQMDFLLGIVTNLEGRRIWSIGSDKTIRAWDTQTGKMVALYEGLNSRGIALSLAPKAPLLAVYCQNGEVLLLHSETLTKVSNFEGEKGIFLGAIAFHPKRKTMATIARGGSEVSLINYDVNDLGLERSRRETTRYANAKVILLGDTGVGKSGLSNQLVYERYEKTDSSHARRAHLLSSEVVETPQDGKVQREILLWDLAGQPAYRLVHQLSVEDAAVACVLCDARRETNPLEGAAYWAQVLEQARSRVPITKFLVASRIDVGGLPASPERMEKFSEEQGFVRFFKTSALSGEGCKELAAAIKDVIPWDLMAPVSSTVTLLAVRQYISDLKGERDPSGGTQAPKMSELRTVGELYSEFIRRHESRFELEEFVSCLERLEQTDVVDVLTFRTAGEVPTEKTTVLLDPTRVDAYASAILVAAKDEPDGPGHLEESRVLNGEFKLEAKERMSESTAEKLVLWYVLESLFRRDLALPEKIKGRNYLVFPAQCTTELRYPDKHNFGVAFEFRGSIRSIYATLIAQFAHYEGFSRREFFQDAARYRPDKGGHCVVRLHDHGNGTAELLVSFDVKAPGDIRKGFLEFVRQHLHDRSVPGSVKERHACQCSKCGEGIDDRAVRARIAASKRTLVCSFCGGSTPLVNLLAPATPASVHVAEKMQEDATTGRQRITAALIIKSKEEQGKYDVFLSHNSKDKREVEDLAKRLKAVGIRPWLDKWDLIPGNTITDALEEAIKSIPCAVLFFGKADVGSWHILEVRAYIEQWAKGTSRMIPAVLPGVKTTPEMPIWVRQNLWVDLRKWKSNRSDAFYRLVCGVVNRKPGASPRTSFTAGDVAGWAESTS